MKENIHRIIYQVVPGILFALLGLAGFLPLDASAQGIITTVAGGGSVLASPATSADIPMPQGVAVDSSGNVFIAVSFAYQVVRLDASGNLTVVAGTGFSGYSGDGGPATSAMLNSPVGVALDSRGNLFIVDNVCVIRRVDAAGIITTAVGNGTCGYSGDSGLATNASLNSLGDDAVTFDSSGNMFIADFGNNVIRRVDAVTQIITTVAGNGTAGYSGDGGLATSASLNSPTGVAVDALGNLFIADLYNNVIRRVDAATQIITTYAGNGTSPSYPPSAPPSGVGGPATGVAVGLPGGIALDSSGDLFIADSYGYLWRVDASGNITIWAGTGIVGFSGDGGPATSAELSSAVYPVIDASGNIFIADQMNNRVRRIDAKSPYNITTLAGGGSGGDGGPATSAVLGAVFGVAVDNSGNIFIPDWGNYRVRRVDASTGNITTVGGNGIGNLPLIGDGGGSWGFWDTGVAVDATGNMFVEDLGGDSIRQVDPLGNITTVAGNGTHGYSGDGGPAIDASLNLAYFPAVAVDSSGNLFIADAGNCVIRRVDTANPRTITTVAGNNNCGYSGDGGPATSASLFYPVGVATDSLGDLFIADYVNNRVRRVDVKGTITTVAGNGLPGFSGDGGPATSASLVAVGIAVDSLGNILISYGNRVRRVDSVTGIISTIAGNGSQGFAGDGGPALNAVFNGEIGLAVDSGGNIFIADGGNRRIRRISAFPVASLISSTAAFGNQPVGTTSPPQPVTLYNSGMAALSISSIATSAEYAQTNTCASSVAAGGNCTISVTFTPTTTGTQTGTLTITDNTNGVSGSSQTIALTGTGSNSGTASVSPASRSFGSQAMGTTSAAKTVTLTSTGTTNLNILSITITGANAGDFGETNNCPASMAPAAKCTISVTFTPSQTGAETAALTFADSAANSPQSAALAGTGLLPVSLSPASPSFSKQAENTTSVAKTVTLTNNLDSALAITSITTSGDFAQTNNCGSSVPANSTCTIWVTFTPGIIGADTGTLTVTDGAANSPQTASLAGTGVLPVTLLPASPSFGKQAENTTSAAKTISLTNNLDSTLAISSITTSGDFAQTNTCGSSVAANTTCTISVTFTPSIIGADTGTLTVTDGAANSPQTASLAGTGVLPVTLLPASPSFGKQAENTTSAAKTITLTNNLDSALTISNITTSGDFAQTNTCGSSVAANTTCTISVTFTPSIIGADSGTLTVTDGAANSPQTASLGGTGVEQAKVAPASLGFGGETVGSSSAGKTVTLTNNLSAALPISITFTGAYPGDFAETDTCAGSVGAASSCTITVTFTPTATGTRTATLNVNDTANNSPQTVALTGTGK
jgi:hypothetical protein